MDTEKIETTAAPAYQQLKDYVRKMIDTGQWRLNDMIPTELSLASEFSLSRMTVHRALRELVSENLLTRVRGRGTFVADRRHQATLIEIHSIADEIRARGDVHRAKVLLVESTQDAAVLQTLELPQFGTAFHSRIVHFENDVPIELEDRYVNSLVFPDYLDQNFEMETPNEYMMRVAPAQGAHYWVTARKASAMVRQALMMPIGEPCLVLRRQTNALGQIASDVTLWHPASRYKLSGSH
ncbi:histidine utilization repressor (plasmid) [Burkholderia sp. PAMC 28687]|uniref:Histidine utilization repressor n=1 Tax=Caballeronia sordidicola TaxID=196367 RepID=A0A242M5A5_CABSO|nr:MULTISPECIES: UTRA domain-containing protein [Burkholderiaceae]AME28449.1 histidine utilization repressor [Burkholderia sp. PAMC 26561]AMM18568.1 histidine utilization repressor [Burkholderia sp. PAMC 28687]OTP66337.1 Histidine utilization repressor [Caballeronia sordidicola]